VLPGESAYTLAEAVLMSMWSVLDRETQELMVLF
jgi:CHAT domain-containing protein